MTGPPSATRCGAALRSPRPAPRLPIPGKGKPLAGMGPGARRASSPLGVEQGRRARAERRRSRERARSPPRRSARTARCGRQAGRELTTCRRMQGISKKASLVLQMPAGMADTIQSQRSFRQIAGPRNRACRQDSGRPSAGAPRDPVSVTRETWAATCRPPQLDAV